MIQTDQYKKICWNCDEEVYHHQEKCPYCGSSLNAMSEREEKEDDLDLEDSLASLYRPPYSVRNQEPAPEIPRRYAYQKAQPRELEEKKGNKELWSLLLLSCGGQLLTLGLLIFFFSDNGFLTLRWKSSHWIFYCLLAIPFLWSGYKVFKKLRF